MDVDGFVTVTYSKRKRGGDKGAVSQEAAAKRQGRKKRKKYELVNFYSFQMREAKREQLAKLREKFEEDKARIEKMKASRKFRPF